MAPPSGIDCRGRGESGVRGQGSGVCGNTFQITENLLGAQAARLHWSGQAARAARNAYASLKGIGVGGGFCVVLLFPEVSIPAAGIRCLSVVCGR
jgi:hypothetical protein